jgi:hypothetical protein
MSDELGKPLPSNLDAERSVLGAILLDNHALNTAVEKLKPGDFSLPEHRRIFQQMIALGEAQQAIDLVTLTEQLRREGQLEAASGPAYLAQLVDGVPRVTNVEHYARIVKEKALLRNLAHTAHAIEQQALEAKGDADAIFDKAESDISRLSGECRSSARVRSAHPWDAESVAEFFSDDGAAVAPLYEPLLYRETVAEMFSPRGIGKSVFALHVAIELARRGKRVLYLDRDNPRRVIRERLRAWGADEELATLKVISRERCPPLTRAELWAQFPYDAYDVVILDSLDSMTEGVGEQDSGKPSRAIAPILDITRREGGPAVLVLGNCVKTGKHSRSSGVVEDRADIVFEVRDATGFHPTGSKPWVEELPVQGAGDWAARSSRRKLRPTFRLAFIGTKFRSGEEPEPFILEVNTVAEPWSLRDVTSEVDREGAMARERRAQEKAETIRAAIEALRVEIVRREQAGEDEILKMKAEAFLTAREFKRNVAREAIASPVFQIAGVDGKGHPKVVRLACKNRSLGGNEGVTEPAKTLVKNDADFRRPHEQGTAEINPSETSIKRSFPTPPISAAGPLLTSPAGAETESERGVGSAEIAPKLQAPVAPADEADWPPESLDAERQWGQPHALLFPLIGKRVWTPMGIGVLLTAFAECCEVLPDGSEKTVRVKPQDVRIIQ